MVLTFWATGEPLAAGDGAELGAAGAFEGQKDIIVKKDKTNMKA